MKQFNRQMIDDELLNTRTVVLYGDSNYGKTSFAKAHFKYPAVVKSNNDYCKITTETDGIIFDDMRFSNFNANVVKNMCDLSSGTHVNVKYGAAYIKRGLRRFICINSEADFWPRELLRADNTLNPDKLYDIRAIRKRVHFIEISVPLYDATEARITAAYNCGKSKYCDKLDEEI
jgi:hypothetical protein